MLLLQATLEAAGVAEKHRVRNVFEFKCFLTRSCSCVIKAAARRHFPQHCCPETCSLLLVPFQRETTVREIIIM